MLGIGIMRGEQYDYILSKQTPQGSYFWGQSIKGRWGRCDSKAASVQGSSLLPRADLSAGEHLLTPRSLQEDCLHPGAESLRAKQVMWISMRLWCHSQSLQGLGGFKQPTAQALNTQKWAYLYASAQILLRWEVLKLMQEEEVDKVLFKITYFSYLPKRGPLEEKTERSDGEVDFWWVTSDEWRGPRGEERCQEQLGWLWEVCRESGFCIV